MKTFWKFLGFAGIGLLSLTVSPAHANLAINLPLQGSLLRTNHDFGGREIFYPVGSAVERKLMPLDSTTENAAKSALPKELTKKLEQVQIMRRFMQSA